MGVALLSTVAAARSSQLRVTGHGAAAALTGGYRLAFVVGTGLSVAALIVAATVLRGRRAEPISDDEHVPVTDCRSV